MIASCPFCDRIRRLDFTETPNPDIVTFTPLNPVTQGHRLFVPIFHEPRFQYAKNSLAAAMYEASAWIGCEDDANLIVSSGPNATQTVNHLHVHLLPRYEGDGLTLPWTGQARA